MLARIYQRILTVCMSSSRYDMVDELDRMVGPHRYSKRFWSPDPINLSSGIPYVNNCIDSSI